MPDNPTPGVPPTAPGGYHSHGVPGEEAAVHPRMRLTKIADPDEPVVRTRPLKGGAGAEAAAADRLAGSRVPRPAAEVGPEVHVIARRGSDELDSPVFRAGEGGGEEAVAVFTTRETAERYIDAAGWDGSDEVGRLPLPDLLRWLSTAADRGVRWVVIDPDRRGHLAGEPQAVLDLAGGAAEVTRALAGRATSAG